MVMCYSIVWFIATLCFLHNICGTAFNDSTCLLDNMVTEYSTQMKLYDHDIANVLWQSVFNMSNENVANIMRIMFKKENCSKAWHLRVSQCKSLMAYNATEEFKSFCDIVLNKTKYSLAQQYNYRLFMQYKIELYKLYNQHKPNISEINHKCNVSNNNMNYQNNANVKEPNPNVTYWLRPLMIRAREDVHQANLAKKLHEKTCLKYNFYRNLRRNELYDITKTLAYQYASMMAAYNQCCVDIGKERRELVNLYTDLSDIISFYNDLHAYLRHYVTRYYEEEIGERIPTYLTGNIWGSDWSSLLKIVDKVERRNISLVTSIDSYLILNQTSVRKLAKEVQATYTSMGLDPLPPNFWDKSIIVNLTEGTDLSIKDPMTLNMNNEQEFRLLLCANPSYSTWSTIFHQFGHIYTYYYRSNLSYLSPKVAPEFEEAIGDVIALWALNPNFTLLGKCNLNFGVSGISYLLYHALVDLPQIMYHLTIATWKYEVLSGIHNPESYQAGWAQLVRSIRGLDINDLSEPEETRGFFDMGLNYFVVNNPDVKLRIKGILNKYLLYQSFKDDYSSSGNFNGTIDDLVDLYGNESAGEKLKTYLTDGGITFLKNFQGHNNSLVKVAAEALLNFYRPLSSFLSQEKIRLNMTQTWKSAYESI